MKTAVVVYSLNGGSAFVAEELKAQLNADLIQLKTVDQKKRGFLGQMIWGGGMAVKGKKPPLQPYTFDPSAYDLIITGVPVWAGRPAPPVLTFLSQTPISGKKIALFVCHAGGAGDALKKLKAVFAGNEIIAEVDFKDPRKNREAVKQQIADWAKTLG